MRKFLVLAAFSLSACGFQGQVSEVSSLGGVQPLQGEKPVFLSDAQYAEQMETLVLPLMAKLQTGTFEGVEKVQIAYYKLEHPSAKAKVAIVPGYGENFQKYRELAYSFYQAGYSVYSYDHRGMGRSGRIAADPEMVYVKNFGDYTEDLKSFLTKIVPQDSKKLMIFGHSMGGGVASDFLVENPNFPVAAAVLNSPMLGIQTGKYPKAIALTIAAGATLVGQGQKYAPGEGPVDYNTWVIETGSTSSKPRFDANVSFVRANKLAAGGTSFGWVKEVLQMSYKNAQSWKAGKVVTPILMSKAGTERLVDNNDLTKFCEQVKKCKLEDHKTSRHESWNEVEAIRVPWLTKAIAHFDAHAK